MHDSAATTCTCGMAPDPQYPHHLTCPWHSANRRRKSIGAACPECGAVATPGKTCACGHYHRAARKPMVLCADGGWTETCEDQEHADRQRLFWDREVPQCAPHRVSWEPVNA